MLRICYLKICTTRYAKGISLLEVKWYQEWIVYQKGKNWGLTILHFNILWKHLIIPININNIMGFIKYEEVKCTATITQMVEVVKRKKACWYSSPTFDTERYNINSKYATKR